MRGGKAWIGILASAIVLALLLLANRWLIGPLVEISGRAVVHDGDTLSIAGERFRLDGLDAPEADQTCRNKKDGKDWACGKEAARQLRALVSGKDVKCRKSATDRFGRGIASCDTDNGVSLNSWMVRQGWAIASGFASPYDDEQYDAKTAGRGIWTSTFEDPAEWRERKPAK